MLSPCLLSLLLVYPNLGTAGESGVWKSLNCKSKMTVPLSQSPEEIPLCLVDTDTSLKVGRDDAEEQLPFDPGPGTSPLFSGRPP